MRSEQGDLFSDDQDTLPAAPKNEKAALFVQLPIKEMKLEMISGAEKLSDLTAVQPTKCLTPRQSTPSCGLKESEAQRDTTSSEDRDEPTKLEDS